MLLACTTIYPKNDNIEGRGKVGQSTVPFPFSPSLLRLVGFVHIKKGNKKVKLVLCGIYIVLISMKYTHVHAQAMKYELCNFGDSIYELNALVLAFKNGIA